MPGVMYFVGLTFTSTWLPPFSDIYGRKKFFLAGMSLCLLFHTGMYFTNHWSVVIAMTFCIGLASSLRIQVGFNYLIELFPEKHRVLAGTIYSCLDGTVYMITTLYFWKIDREWSKYFLLVFGANIISLIGSSFLPESPRMLVDLGKEDEAIESLEQIARCNGNLVRLGDLATSNRSEQRLNEGNSLDTTSNMTKKDRSSIVWDTLKRRDVLCNLLFMIVIWTAASFNFYLLMYITNTFEQVYVTAFALAIADIVAYATGGVLV